MSPSTYIYVNILQLITLFGINLFVYLAVTKTEMDATIELIL